MAIEKQGLEVYERGGAVIALIPPELDFGNASQIHEALDAIAVNQRAVVVSLERCRFCDSTGWTVLVALRKRLGRNCALVVPIENVMMRKIIGILELERLFTIRATVDDALDIVATAS